MMKRHKKAVIITSLVTLLPLFAGLILWNKLPAQIATHFGLNGEPNGWSGKFFTVFGLPLFLIAVHMICAFVTSLDPKGQNISDKVYVAVLWIVPVVSLFCGYSIYSHALGYSEIFSVGKSTYLLMGIMFLVLGNYLPKSGSNYTVGIKLPWTLSDEDNWRKTHRLAGRIYIIGGIICIINIFLEWHWLFALILLASVLIPSLYSFCLYQKKKKG